jgi:sugar lactone lactonase YvrE
LYVAEYFGNRIRKITSTGVVTTFAGSTLGIAGTVNDTGTAARFDAPYGIAIDAQGNIYVSQPNSNTRVMRKITSTGVVTTLAGGATTVQDGTGTNAGFSQPLGVCTDTQGNIYVGDRISVRKITSAGVVTTVAGSLTMGGTTEGTGANARFSEARSICTDNLGFVYLTDNNRVRKVSLTTNEVTTLTGNIATFGNTDGTLANATFGNVYGLSIDSAGIIYASENGRIRKIE